MEESHQEPKKEKIKFEMDRTSFYKYTTVILGVLLVVSLFTGGFGIGRGNKGTTGNDNIIIKQPTNGQQPETSLVKIDISNANVLGDENAPLTLVEFSDFQCPFCSRFYEQTLPQVLENYVDSGKVKLVYKHLPLSFHQYAQISAEASECAAEQEKFWELHDKIFENQGLLSEASLKQGAVDIGLDADEFNTCLDSGKYTEKVNADFAQATSVGAGGTPTFFIGKSNGESIESVSCPSGVSICGNADTGFMIIGAQPFTSFKQSIDSMLSN